MKTRPVPVPLKRLSFDGEGFERLTHYLFRYPAKFHPPVIRELIRSYSSPGDRILDPFCGSGTLLIEAAVAGRHAVGTDIDPVAVFVSKVKTNRYNVGHLTRSSRMLLKELRPLQRSATEYVTRQFVDLSPTDFTAIVEAEALWVPEIPNLHHWFRRYVIVDLARIYRQIITLHVPETHRDFLRLCFASIIRAASNADPVPVSGLEVTAHMKRKDAEGRIVNPFYLLHRAIDRALFAVDEFRARAVRTAKVSVLQSDAVSVSSRLRSRINAVITSPPYHNAVDYYRRHQLEMFWLGFTGTQEDRLALLPHYIGRPKVPMRHPYVAQARVEGHLAGRWESRIRKVSPERANAFKHYVVAMRKSLSEIAAVLDTGCHALLIVGHSTWNGDEVPTGELFEELASALFVLEDRLWYPVENKYMSYNRHNGASIDREYVLVFRRT
jgi:16S rRNA G966 N2-methylase RsmD